jgi:hypothetical protein
MDRWSQADGVLVRESLGHLVLLPRGSDVPVIANASSAAVWRALADVRTVPEIVERIRRAFDLDADAAEHGVERALAELSRSGVALRGR